MGTDDKAGKLDIGSMALYTLTFGKATLMRDAIVGEAAFPNPT